MNIREILTFAIQCDKEARIFEAQYNYQEGIQMLMDLVSGETDVAKKKVYLERIKDYVDRAEQIKGRIQRHMQQGQLLESISIEEDGTGYSYKKLFGKYLNNDLKEVLLEEPYLQKKHQFTNLIMFLELLVKKCRNFKFIRIITKTDSLNSESQQTTFDQIKEDLNKRQINMALKFEDSLHDRKIFFGSGIIIRIGRGLDIYKPVSPLHSLGLIDHDFRKCLQTDVVIWKTQSIVG